MDIIAFSELRLYKEFRDTMWGIILLISFNMPHR